MQLQNSPFYRSSMEISLENNTEINGRIFVYPVILNTLIFLALVLMEQYCFPRNNNDVNVTCL